MKTCAKIEELAKHADWAEEFMGRHPEFNADNAEDIIKDEIGQVFAQSSRMCGRLQMHSRKEEITSKSS